MVISIPWTDAKVAYRSGRLHKKYLGTQKVVDSIPHDEPGKCNTPGGCPNQPPLTTEGQAPLTTSETRKQVYGQVYPDHPDRSTLRPTERIFVETPLPVCYFSIGPKVRN